MPKFQPYVADESNVAEFTPKAIVIGALFGIIFGASTVYLALKAGLTVSASIPIAVLSISLLKRLGGSTILENNVVQTIGSAGESVAAGVVFTLPGFLFLSRDETGNSIGEPFFSYWTIFTLALLGGVLGVLMMIPLRRALIVNEHETLPYPEGTACAGVLIAGEKGGRLAAIAYQGLGFAFVYAIAQKVLGVIAETPTWVSSMKSKVFPAATVAGDITPEYMGVGFILGARSTGMLVAGGVLAWLGMIPLLATLVPGETIATQLVKIGYEPGRFGYDPATHDFAQLNVAIYFAYIRQIGAGAVAAGGFITLLKTLPTIVGAVRGSLGSVKAKGELPPAARRTERDLPMSVVVGGSVGLAVIVALLPFIPGDGIGSKLLLGVLMVVFGFFFVTVSSRIVGLIGSSNNPISGMTIATLMATCLIFAGLGWTGDAYQPMALCVGGMVCIAAANAGATSQDLKTGYLVGATPRAQQIGLFIGVVAAAFVIGATVQLLDNAHVDPETGKVVHAIGETFSAPQGTLMATLIKGLLSFNLDWQFVLVGVFLAITVELCGVSALAFAVGAYLPLATTLPIFAGGVVRYVADRGKPKPAAAEDKDEKLAEAEEEFGPGNLYSTGLVAGGALAGVLYAIAAARMGDTLGSLSLHETLVGVLGPGGYDLLGVGCFALMAWMLIRTTRKG
ncbi:MAG: oligopeptide transporter, OPT family [Nannocystaceae bacterium]|nr:oligopeptide transporter, OPT family [Deltaproteobacteria bacterium]MBK8716365.1 oligopeptide transporter, OPT family [Deltaproteobacteria bacterium]MBP7287913.1 oligopeptide transporter, OPT family [Nannocystaceae bacterium]